MKRLFHLSVYRNAVRRLAAWSLALGAVLAVIGGPSRAQNLVDSGQPLPGVAAGEGAWGDYDGDGDLDLALIGETVEDGQCRRIARVYRNDFGFLEEDTAQSDRLVGVYYGDVGWADYDNDGDLDLAIAGWDERGVESLLLYLNEEADDGSRLLTLDLEQSLSLDGGEDTAELKGVRYARLAWADYDGDGDWDLAVAGMDKLGLSLTRLYRNQDGLFALDSLNERAVLNLHNARLAWADYDGDGDLDLAASGDNVTRDGGLGPQTEFYRNVGLDTLRLDESESLELGLDLRGGDLAWGDYDQDGRADLAVAGRGGNWFPVLALYRNRPAGFLSFDERFALNPFQQVDGGLAWSDYNADGNPDLAVSGRTVLSQYNALVFAGDGLSLAPNPAEFDLPGLFGGAVEWADYDGDARPDLLLSGVDAQGQPQTRLMANFSPQFNDPPRPPTVLNTPQVAGRRLLFSWSPGSDDRSKNLSYDLRIGSDPGRSDILAGSAAAGDGAQGTALNWVLNRFLTRGTFYWSVRSVDGSGIRSEWAPEQIFRFEQFGASEQELAALEDAAMAWGDYDDDGDLDLVAMGTDRGGDPQTLLYDNNGGTLALNRDIQLPGLTSGAAAWGDYDNDGDLDLALTGSDVFDNPFSLLYDNEPDGAGRQLALFAGFEPERANGSVAWGDHDNDGDLDLLLLGQTSHDPDTGLPSFRTDLFVNDGERSFDNSDFQLVGLVDGEGAWGDYDSDGDADLVLVGQGAEGPQFKLYVNEGGSLADSGQDLPGIQTSDVAWGDYDRDGDLDLAAAGETSGGALTAVFNNDGGTLTALQGVDFTPVFGGDLAWGDYDNDQDLDLVLSGTPDRTQRVLEVYQNTIGRVDASVPFEREDIFLLQDQGMAKSATALVDVEGDGDLDMVSVGEAGDFNAEPIAVFNDNLEGVFNPNVLPLPPTPVGGEDQGNSAVMRWEAGRDDGDPPSESLSYDLRVGTAPESGDVLAGSWVLGGGNVGHTLEHRLVDLESGVYFWATRTVDAGLVRSAWSLPDSFTVDTVPPELNDFVVSRRQAGIGVTVSLGLRFTDAHAGIDENTAPEVVAVLGGAEFAFSTLQFTGGTWSGELVISPDMPAGVADVRVRGLLDRKGNAMVAVDSLAVFEIDTELPAVIGSDPAPNQRGVASGLNELEVSFSESLELQTVEGSFQLKLGGVAQELLGAPDYDDEELEVSFVPAGGLLPGSRYTVEVSSAVQDLAGNRPANAITWTFETAVPQVESLTPAAGEEDVPVEDASISIVFDNAIDETALRRPDVVRLLLEGAEVSLNEVAYDPETRTAIVTPTRGLRAGSLYRVSIDPSVGGPLRQAPYDWSFSTRIPALASTTPSDKEQGVSVSTTTIQAVFSAPTARQEADDFVLTARPLGGGAPPALVSLAGFGADSTGTTISFAPQDGFLPAHEYVIIGSEDVLGNLAPEGFEWRFRTAPRLEDATAGGGVDNGDGRVELFFPPNGLDGGSGEIIIRPLGPPPGVGLDVGLGKVIQLPELGEGLTRVGQPYVIDAGEATLRKPTTLFMRVGEVALEGRAVERLSIFSLVDGAWERLGGIPGPSQAPLDGPLGQAGATYAAEVRTAVRSFGTFAVVEDLNAAVGSLRIAELDCQPRAFSPLDQRGETDISFRLSAPADVTVRVYNTSGRLERVILRGEPMAAGVASLAWDGRDGDAKAVSSGLYIVVVNAGDARQQQVVGVVR